MIVTGDITQIDLPRGQRSGLVNVREVLATVPDIAFVYFDSQDVVRHKLVQEIVSAYKLHAEQHQTVRKEPSRKTTARRPGDTHAGATRASRLQSRTGLPQMSKEHTKWRERLVDFRESIEDRDSRASNY